MSGQFISTLVSIAVGAVTDVSFPPRPGKHLVHGVFLAEHVHCCALSRDAHPIRHKLSTDHGRRQLTHSKELTNSPFSCSRRITVMNEDGMKQFMHTVTW